jgi:methylated-DNA-protein-cysteine methyltransferase related protein
MAILTWAEQVYAVVSIVPRGRVCSYGDVAYALGCPQRPRQVGNALSALSKDRAQLVPWQRVVNTKGYLSIRGEFMAKDVQRALLLSEGVEVSDDYLVVQFAALRHLFAAPGLEPMDDPG